MSLKDVAKKILESKKIGISFHVSPDGDAMGSALALLNGLRYLKKDAYIISKDVIAENLEFLSLGNEVDGNTVSPVQGTDLVVVVDCGNFERISADLSFYKGFLINVDHHISNDEYGNLNYVDAKAASTGEIIFELLNNLSINFNEKTDILKKIGTCLYTTIVTDTGSFRHSNVTERTHKIASMLISVGVDNTDIYRNLFDNRKMKKLNLMGYAFETARLYFQDKVIVVGLSEDVLKKYDCEQEDTSDVIGNLLSVKGVEVAVLLKETADGTKASLRSKNNFDVRRVAECFGGGGHIKASGVMQKGVYLEDAKESLLEKIESELEVWKA
ncbi:MAG: DHH family phosphoesterase [Clostridium sp.]|uniref:DHH family phosphoesterase n=1 Tax=Clostridium sp. TaxID=1506 RepID=UPI003F3F9763